MVVNFPEIGVVMLVCEQTQTSYWNEIQ